ASDAFSQQDAILIFIPILFVWVLFLDWDSKQPSADDVTGYGALGPTVDGPTPEKEVRLFLTAGVERSTGSLGICVSAEQVFVKMARNSFAVTAVAVLAVVGVGSCFLTGLPQGSQPPRAAPNAVEHEMPQPSMAGNSWAAPLLSFGAALGLIFGIVAAKRLPDHLELLWEETVGHL
ncbi:PSBO, partial [Symbiodinium microadriaticum]